MTSIAEPPDLGTLLGGRSVPTLTTAKSSAPTVKLAPPPVTIPAGVNPAEGKPFCATCNDSGFAQAPPRGEYRMVRECACRKSNPVLADRRRTACMLRGAA